LPLQDGRAPPPRGHRRMARKLALDSNAACPSSPLPCPALSLPLLTHRSAFPRIPCSCRRLRLSGSPTEKKSTGGVPIGAGEGTEHAWTPQPAATSPEPRRRRLLVAGEPLAARSLSVPPALVPDAEGDDDSRSDLPIVHGHLPRRPMQQGPPRAPFFSLFSF
jgi:hypothetical protein